MENIKIPVIFTSVYLLIYSMLPAMDPLFPVMFTLFVIGQFLVIWMVVRVLKDGRPSGNKFNEGRWYDDLDYNAGSE